MYIHSLTLNTRRSVLSVIEYSIVDLLFDIIKFHILSFFNSSLFVLSILTHLDSHLSVVSVNCISFILYSFISQASTSEEILQHLHSLHQRGLDSVKDDIVNLLILLALFHSIFLLIHFLQELFLNLSFILHITSFQTSLFLDFKMTLFQFIFLQVN